MSMSKSSLPARDDGGVYAQRHCPCGGFAQTRAARKRLSAGSVVSFASFASLASLLTLTSAGCLNPQDDYNAYVSRASDAAPPTTYSSSSRDAGFDAASLVAPDAGFEQPKLGMVCLSQLATDVAKAILFVADIKYVGGSNGGTLTYTTQDLPAGSTNIHDAIADSTLGPFTGAIAANGSGVVTLGNLTLPAAQNGITGVDVPITNASFTFHVESSTQICAGLDATITQPAVVKLSAPLNPCVFVPTDSAGNFVLPMTNDIHCP